MKRLYIFILAATMLSACEVSDIAPEVNPNQEEQLRMDVGLTAPMMVGTNESGTRATLGYELYDPEIHPTTMGGFGLKRVKSSASESDKIWHYIFLDRTDEVAEMPDYSDGHSQHIFNVTNNRWEYFNTAGDMLSEKWNTAVYDMHLFFAYMPYQPETVVDGVTYKVSLKRSISDTHLITLQIPFIPGMTQIPYMVCREPQLRHLTETGTNDYSRVPFQMDQIMQRYVFQFKLDPAMGELRHFHITNVEMFGAKMPSSALFTRNYTYSVGQDDAVKWSYTDNPYENIQFEDRPESNPFVINKPIWKNRTDSYFLNLRTDQYRTYGETYEPIQNETTPPSYFYVIQTGEILFNPTIKVSYEIYDEWGYLTRKGVGRIVFNTDQFNSIGWLNEAGCRHEININIVPNRLYVLSDADQTCGYLIMDETNEDE